MNVQVGDENGRKGGDDKYCTVNVKLDRRDPIHVRAKHANIYKAIETAVSRAAVVVSKRLNKRLTNGLGTRHGAAMPLEQLAIG